MSTDLIPLDSIEIPPEYIALCADWHSGQDCMLYAVASTGGLTMGSIRPYDDGLPLSDEEWYLSIWNSLSTDIAYCVRQAKKTREQFAENEAAEEWAETCSDVDDLSSFERFADDICEKLAKSYGLDE